MDFFDDGINYSAIVDRINEEKRKITLKYKNNSFKAVFVLTCIASLSIFLIITYGSNQTLLFIPIIGLFSISLLIYGIGSSVVNSKIKNTYLNNEVINLYNNEQGTFIKYDSKIKIKRDFNDNMGLFNKFANVSAKYRITGDSGNHHDFSIMDCTLITSNGKSATVHFDGIYFIINVQTSKYFQIRTNGKPHLKGKKFVKILDAEAHSFILEDDPQGYIDPKYYNIFNSVKNKIDSKALYLASNMDQVHLGVVLKNKQKLSTNITYETFKEYSNQMFEIINTAFNIASSLDEF